MQDVVAESAITGELSEDASSTKCPVNSSCNEDTGTSNQELVEGAPSFEIKEKPGSSNQGDDKSDPSNLNTLTVNKTFVVNTLKQATDHNRYKTNQESKHLRKFQNEQRKKHTVKNLSNSFSPRKTLYSDLITVVPVRKNGQLVEKESKIITPFEQVQKLVSEAAQFDAMHEPGPARVVRKPARVMVDKTLLRNHLRHTTVHNRLQEETEMWELHDSKATKLFLRTKGDGERSMADRGGGMYADREGSHVKVTRVKHTPDPVTQRLFGSATRKLLELEKKMPDRWGHDGFKEVYVDELYNPGALKKVSRQAKASRKIVVNNSLRDRLNSSIELSDEDEMRRDRKKRRKILHEDLDQEEDVVVVSKIKRTIKQNTRKVNLESEDTDVSVEEMDDDSLDKEVNTRKRSVITVVPQKKVQKRQQHGPELARKKILTKRTLGTLQSDLIEEQKALSQNVTRNDSISGRWGHDGFKKLEHNEASASHSENEDKTRGRSLKKNKCLAKNRIGVLEIWDSEDSSQESIANRNDMLNRISKVKKQINRQSRPKNVEASKKVLLAKKKVFSPKMNVVPKKRVVQDKSSPVQLSDSDEEEEWTEKKEVDRATLRNSIHEDEGESSLKSSVKSRLGQRRRDPSSDGSSFTDSSDEEPNIKRRLGRR